MDGERPESGTGFLLKCCLHPLKVDIFVFILGVVASPFADCFRVRDDGADNSVDGEIRCKVSCYSVWSAGGRVDAAAADKRRANEFVDYFFCIGYGCVKVGQPVCDVERMFSSCRRLQEEYVAPVFFESRSFCFIMDRDHWLVTFCSVKFYFEPGKCVFSVIEDVLENVYFRSHFPVTEPVVMRFHDVIDGFFFSDMFLFI